jgi:hypothetical protein
MWTLHVLQLYSYHYVFKWKAWEPFLNSCKICGIFWYVYVQFSNQYCCANFSIFFIFFSFMWILLWRLWLLVASEDVRKKRSWFHSPRIYHCCGVSGCWLRVKTCVKSVRGFIRRVFITPLNIRPTADGDKISTCFRCLHVVVWTSVVKAYFNSINIAFKMCFSTSKPVPHKKTLLIDKILKKILL